MPTPRLSDASEKRILDALDAVHDLTAAGASPTDALYKVATDRQIPAGHVRLMASAINTGHTNSRRLASADLFEKAGEFPLADAHDVLCRMYPLEVKTAAAARRETAVSAEYARGPGRVLEKAAGLEKRASAASRVPPAGPAAEPYAVDPTAALEKLASAVQRAEAERSESRLRASARQNECVKLAADIVDYFRRPGALPYADVSYNASELFGTRAQALMTMVGDRLPAGLVKRASSGLHAVRMDKEPYSLIRRMLDAGREYFLEKEAYDGPLAEAVKEARGNLRPFVQRPQWGRSVLESPSSTDATKEAGLGNVFATGLGAMGYKNMAQNAMMRMPGAMPDPQRKEMDTLSKLMDPGHEMDIRNIQSEAMLNNLLANDDVISRHPSQDVLDAYNEVSQLAPHASSQTALMRDMIRKRLAGGPGALDSFAIDSLVGTNNKIKQRDEASKPNLEMLQSYGVLPNGPPKSASVLR